MKIPATVNSSIFWFFNNHFNCKLKSFRKDKNRQQIVTELICVDAFMFTSMELFTSWGSEALFLTYHNGLELRSGIIPFLVFADA